MKKLFPLLFVCVSAHSQTIDLDLPPVTFTPSKSPFIAVGLSTLMPGLGHAYLGDYQTAGGLLGSSSVYLSISVLKPNTREIFGNVLSNTWMYGIYAAYRDVRAYNTMVAYSYPMPTETLGELALAPFQWSVMKKPEVWGGLLADLSLAIGLQFLFSHHISHSTFGAFSPLLAFPIGIGEESFFRGYLQSSLAEFCTPWGGIALSSLAFGAAHIGNAEELIGSKKKQYYAVSLPFITLSGLYYGWVTYKNGSLKESVALHAWYDFAIFLAGYTLSETVGWQKPNFAFSFVY